MFVVLSTDATFASEGAVAVYALALLARQRVPVLRPNTSGVMVVPEAWLALPTLRQRAVELLAFLHHRDCEYRASPGDLAL